MKKLIICFLLVSVLLQSCVSYRTVDLKDNPLVEGKKYKIKQNNKFVVLELVKQTDNTLTIKRDNEVKEIPLSEITEIKASKISAGKTIALCAGITVGVVLVSTAIILEGSSNIDYNTNIPYN